SRVGAAKHISSTSKGAVPHLYYSSCRKPVDGRRLTAVNFWCPNLATGNWLPATDQGIFPRVRPFRTHFDLPSDACPARTTSYPARHCRNPCFYAGWYSGDDQDGRQRRH